MSTPIGGATQGFWIEAGEVKKAGEAARKVAQDLPEDIKSLFNPTDAAVAGLVGFESAKAIDDCLEAWAKALRSLAGMIESVADAVDSTNKSFAHEDHERRRSFLGLGPCASGASGPYAPGHIVPQPMNEGR